MSGTALRPAAAERSAPRCCCCSSFAMLAQRRIVTLVNLLAVQGALLCVATLLLAWRTGPEPSVSLGGADAGAQGRSSCRGCCTG